VSFPTLKNSNDIQLFIVPDMANWDTSPVLSQLTLAEQARLQLRTHKVQRHQFLTSRWLIKRLLSDALGIPGALLSLTLNNHNQPRIYADNKALNISVSLSHSQASLALALQIPSTVRDTHSNTHNTQTPTKLGVDIELLRRPKRYKAIAETFFHPHDLNSIHSPADFLTCWTQKEALVKALNLPIDQVFKTPVVTLAEEHGMSLQSAIIGNGCWTLASEETKQLLPIQFC
jgi:phosphopantetheinyl transferase